MLSEGTGRPGPSAACRAAAMSPRRGRRSSSSGRSPAASCGPGADRSDVALVEDQRLRQGDRGAAQVGVPVAGDEDRRGTSGSSPGSCLAAAEHLGRQLRPEVELAAVVGLERRRDREGAERRGVEVGSEPPPRRIAADRQLPQLVGLIVNSRWLALSVDRADARAWRRRRRRGSGRRRRGSCAVSGIDEERHPDHDDAEVEGPGDGRGERPPGRAARPCRGPRGRRCP